MKAPLIAVLVLLPVISATAGRNSASREGRNGGTVEAQGASAGRFSAGSVSAESANGATYDASGARVGRFGTAQSSAQGVNGNTVDRSAKTWNGAAANGATTSSTYNNDTTVNRAGTYNANTGAVNRTGATSTTVNPNAAYNSATVYESNTTTYNGYRSGYVYRGGTYTQANVTVNSVYIAPVGAYAGWQIMTQPQYVAYPVYATYPVEVSVQVALTQQGYYNGPIDGSIGPKTQQAIAKYQSANNLPPTGQINKALLKSLGIS